MACAFIAACSCLVSSALLVGSDCFSISVLLLEGAESSASCGKWILCEFSPIGLEVLCTISEMGGVDFLTVNNKLIRTDKYLQ